MRKLLLSLCGCCVVFAVYSGSASAPEVPLAISEPMKASASPLLMGIRDVESSRGRNCRPGEIGERTCWQIRPETAEMLGCNPFYVLPVNEGWAVDCTKRWQAVGKLLCSRWDDYARARFHNRGRCMGWRTKPSAYEMEVNRAKLRWL